MSNFNQLVPYNYNAMKEQALNEMYSLVGCSQAKSEPAYNIPCAPQTPCKETTKKTRKGSNMYIDLDCDGNFNKAEVALNRMTARVYSIYNTKEAELRKKFYTENDARPRTAKELIDRITTGKYVVKEDRLNEDAYDPDRYIVWRDPSHPADVEGYKTAVKALSEARTKAEDIIVVMSDEAAQLKALQDFESTTIN